MKRFLSLFLFLFSLILLTPLDSFACACCADPGFYKIAVKSPGSYEMDELKRLKFRDASVYADAGFPDTVKGIDPLEENYKVTATLNSDEWNFSFKDKNGKEGTLKLKMPKTFVDFAVDTRSGEKGGAGSVVLYKEWRFKYKVGEGTGIFQKGTKGKPEYFLVLQGKGNVCNSAEDYTHWRLEVTGKNAAFAFFGDLDTGTAAGEKTEAQPKNDVSSEADVPDDPDSELNAVLLGTDYRGCGCSGITLKEAKKKGTKKLFFWS
ncbi:MAG: hypothetical protein KDB79_05925 [Acidobacteria bacterium]|nr:hypothetical protein [Acidobacteriota bacterium]